MRTFILFCLIIFGILNVKVYATTPTFCITTLLRPASWSGYCWYSRYCPNSSLADSSTIGNSVRVNSDGVCSGSNCVAYDSNNNPHSCESYFGFDIAYDLSDHTFVSPVDSHLKLNLDFLTDADIVDNNLFVNDTTGIEYGADLLYYDDITDYVVHYDGSVTDDNGTSVPYVYDPLLKKYTNTDTGQTYTYDPNTGTYVKTAIECTNFPDCTNLEEIVNCECVCKYGKTFSGSCNPAPDSCTLDIPQTFNGLSYLGTFNDFATAQQYFDDNNILNGSIYNAQTLGGFSDCTKVFAYGNNQENSCVNVIPPSIDSNGYPLQLSFNTIEDCFTYINSNSLNGSCKVIDSCYLAFGYWDSPDGGFNQDENNTIPPIENNVSNIDYTQDNDNNYTFPSFTDYNDTDNIDLSPMLNQLASVSQSNHNDLVNLADKQDITNNQLSNINTKLDSFSNTNHDDLTKLHDDLNTLFGVPGDVDIDFNQFTDFADNVKNDFSSMSDIFDNLKNVVSGGYDTPTLSRGEDPTFTADVFNKPLTISLCSPFSVYRPFVSFFIVINFFIWSIRVYILGFKEL